MTDSVVFKWFWCCWLLVVTFTAYAKEAPDTPGLAQQNVITTTPPKGFDDLIAPQTTLIDIYFNHVFVGSSMAQFTAEKLTFLQPDEVLPMLSQVAQPQTVLVALSEPLATNAAEICHQPEQSDCGVLTPLVVGVIFNENLLRAEIFINPALLSSSPVNLERYLPASQSGAGMINRLSLVAAGGNQRDSVYTLGLSSVASYDNFRLLSNIESDEDNGSRLDQLSIIYESRDMAYQLGTFRTLSQASDFFGQRDFIGLRVQSTLASRTDLEQVSGSQIFVFLNERSRVEVYKEGQLIDTQLYQAGNIELDTRNFPTGSYMVELKIIGNSGRERLESHFYAKSLQLPPNGESLFFIEAGYPENNNRKKLPSASEDALARLGYITRLSDYLGVSASLVKTSQRSNIELGSFWLASRLELQTNYAWNNESESASYYSFNYRHPRFFVSAAYRRTRANDLASSAGEFDLININSRQTSINIGVPLVNSTLNIFSRSNFQDKQGHSRAIGLSWRKRLYQASGMLFDWNIDLTKERLPSQINENRIMTGFTLRFIQNRLSFDSQLSYHIDRANSRSQNYWNKTVRAGYQNVDSNWGNMAHSLELNQTDARNSATLQSHFNNHYASSRIAINHINSSRSQEGGIGQSQTDYSISSRVNLVTNGQTITLGGTRQNNAGMVIDLTSINVEKLSFAVIVNELEYTRVKAGNRSFVALEPYKSYEVMLSPIGSTLVEFDNTPRKFTLYPGNVESFQWQVKEVRVVIMQLIDKTVPFTNAKWQHPSGYARTDSDGWVQLEIDSTGEQVFRQFNGATCRILVSREDLKDKVNFLGEKNCQ